MIRKSNIIIIMIIINTLFASVPALGAFSHEFVLFGHDVVFKALDYVALVILTVLTIIYFATIISDAQEYARIDPPRDK